MFSTKFSTALLMCLAAISFERSAFAADTVHYGVKESQPRVGTTVPKEIVKAGAIPLNKSYSELTAEQKEALNAEYDHMAPGDEPPFPVKGLFPIYKAIARAHETLDLANRGEISFNVLIDSQGNPKSVEIVHTPNDEIAQVAVTTIMSQKYKPAVCAGKPCSMQLPLHAELIGSTSNISDSNTPGVFSTQVHSIPGK